jgi:hypothetical protein
LIDSYKYKKIIDHHGFPGATRRRRRRRTGSARRDQSEAKLAQRES